MHACMTQEILHPALAAFGSRRTRSGISNDTVFTGFKVLGPKVRAGISAFTKYKRLSDWLVKAEFAASGC